MRSPDDPGQTPMGEDGFDKEFWEDHYLRNAGSHHGGGPNPSLVTEAGDLEAGRALDAGCGHGGDAHWLAERGWQVTAVDVSATALAHARNVGASDGDGVEGRISWVEADLGSWSPPEESFDLVTSHYVHVPATARETFVRGLAAAVAPGGTLLVVGHDASGLDEGVHGSDPEAYMTAEDVAALLDPDTWDIAVAAVRLRQVGQGDGRQVTIRDAVLRARKRG